MFIDRLIEKIKEKNNPTCIGLDPKIDYVPEFLKDKYFKEFGKNSKGATEAIYEFNKRLIDAVHDIIPAVKPQIAYYEMYGLKGLAVFDRTVKYAKEKGMIVIGDGKRNDIGSTASAYSAAYLGRTLITNKVYEKMFDVDSLTVNPYLGIDGIKPFMDSCREFSKGIFVLVKTSNKSSGQLQDLKIDNGKAIYEVMAEYVNEWGSEYIGNSGYSSIGAVVGATYPEQAKILREIMKKAFFLVPGYGAQGGDAKDVANSFNEDGLGAIINSSRGLMCAYKSELWSQKFDDDNFDEACRSEAIRMRDDINSVVESK